MTTLIAVPVGIVIGLALGSLGGGGSILAVPALVYLLGQDPKAATATSLVIVGAVALGGAIPHWRSGRVRLRSGVLLGVAGVGGSFLGSWANQAVDPRVLMLSFAGLIVVTAIVMYLRARRDDTTGDRDDGGGGLATGVQRSWATVGKVLAAGTGVGLLTGFFGVGGGFIVVPALVLVLGFRMPEAVGTSLVVIAINSLAAMVARAGGGVFDWPVVLAFTATALAGVYLGSQVADRFSGPTLQRAFAALLLVLGVTIGVDQAAGNQATGQRLAVQQPAPTTR